MQRNTLDRKWQQTDENAALYKCNLCPRAFITNHGRNIHLSSCRKKFSQEDLTTRLQNSQQEQVQANVNNTAGSQIISSSIEPKLWGDHTKDDIRHKIDVIYEKIAFWRRNLTSKWSGRKEIYLRNHKVDRILEPRCERVQGHCTESVNGDACSTSPEAFVQVDSETTLPMPLKTVNTMGTG